MTDEEKTYKGLKDKSDRQEFQKIFWARRDPDLETPENEFQAEYMKAYAEADSSTRSRASGVETDCGRIFLLLGKPDDVKKDEAAQPRASLARDLDLPRPARPDLHRRQGRDRARRECRSPGRLKEQLDRLAEAKVVQPNIGYRVGKDGHLVKLADLLPEGLRGPGPAQEAAPGLPGRGAGRLPEGRRTGHRAGRARSRRGQRPRRRGGGGKKTVKVVVAASAVAEDGKGRAWRRDDDAAVVKDGSFLASFKLAKAGKYTLKAGAIDVEGRQGVAGRAARRGAGLSKVETAPDGTFAKMATAGCVLVVRASRTCRGRPDPQHPFAAFALAKARLIPVFGGTLHKADRRVLLPGLRPED